MEIKKYTEHVEYDRDVVDYIASDGKVFMDQDACLMYEKRLEIESHPVFRSRREITLWPDDKYAALYYLRSEEDHNWLKQHCLCEKSIQDDFAKFGPGFYIAVNVDGGDSSDVYRLHHANYYIHILELELDNFQNDLKDLMQDIQST